MTNLKLKKIFEDSYRSSPRALDSAENVRIVSSALTFYKEYELYRSQNNSECLFQVSEDVR